MKLIAKLTVAAAAFSATTTFGVSPGHAYGDAPWCAVISVGTGEVYWDCQYRTFDECVPNVIAGNRGFCNLNPYGPGPSTPAPAPHRKRHIRGH